MNSNGFLQWLIFNSFKIIWTLIWRIFVAWVFFGVIVFGIGVRFIGFILSLISLCLSQYGDPVVLDKLLTLFAAKYPDIQGYGSVVFGLIFGLLAAYEELKEAWKIHKRGHI